MSESKTHKCHDCNRRISILKNRCRECFKKVYPDIIKEWAEWDKPHHSQH